MEKNYLTCLISSLLLLASSSVFGQRPAAEEESGRQPESVLIEDDLPAMEDMRPATEAESIPQETSTRTETRTSGDVLDMSGAPQTEAVAQPVRQLEFPRRGMSQDKVQNELGRPIEIIPAVGEPPISRWVYDDRVVYFEYSSVIHVVAKQ
jgi:hypothetical protein